MRQLTLATGTFETHRKPTRREKFLSDMEKVVPWQDLCAVIAPYYPNPSFAIRPGTRPFSPMIRGLA